MNAASQLLRILAIVGAIAAGALYYLSTKPGMLGSGGSAAQNPAQTATASADAAKNSQALSDAQADAAVADNARAQALAQLNSDEKKAKDLQSASDDKDTQIADLTTKLGAVDDLNKQISDLKDQNAQLQQQIAAGPVAPAPVAGSGTSGTSTATATTTAAPTATVAAAAPAPVQLTPAAPAKILQINSQQWLMVLNVGTADGVQKDSQLQLKVGDEDIGTAVVRDSQDGISTVAITSTGGISPDDYFVKIVKKNLNVQYQRVE
jgi:polyhydroxyalkanoate synthesis regulator phasin